MIILLVVVVFIIITGSIISDSNSVNFNSGSNKNIMIIIMINIIIITVVVIDPSSRCVKRGLCPLLLDSVPNRTFIITLEEFLLSLRKNSYKVQFATVC